MAQKIRLDVSLFERGVFGSREKARSAVMTGIIYVNNQKEDKPGFQVCSDDIIEVRGDTLKYVSRGGLKLEKALKNFNISLDDAVCMDIGASTGGFTDCMLQHGAAKVYAVDVGYGQLAWKLRSDSRVVSMERTNIRYVKQEDIGRQLDFCSVDVSFISLTLVLPVVRELLRENGEFVCLIKPQFEAGKGVVGKKGVVRDPRIHVDVVEKITEFILSAGFDLLHVDFSPIKGPEGNIEYLAHARMSVKPIDFTDGNIQELVERSHRSLDDI